MTPKYTRGWIRMQVMSAMIDIGKWVPGIANNDTELRHSDAVLIMSYLSGRLGKTLEWNRSQPRHGIKVSTMVGYLEAVLNSNNGAPPESPDNSESSP
ncbi:MAG: hypothetical protein Q8R17_01045 [bacterium]|nr:hypothetical protein [bacterium]